MCSCSAILAAGGEIAVQQQRGAQRLGQAHHLRAVAGVAEVPVVGKPRRNERAGDRHERQAVDRVRAGPVDPGHRPVCAHAAPAQFAGPRRVGKRIVEPGREPGHEPFAPAADRRIGGNHHAAALVRILAAQPAHHEAYLALVELRAFVEADEVVRPALPGEFGARPVQRPELEQASRPAQDHVGPVVAFAAAQDLDQPLLDPAEVRIGAAEDHRARVPRDREAEQQVGLAAARRAAIEHEVGLGFVGFDLRPVARIGRPDRRNLTPECCVELQLCAPRRLGEHGARVVQGGAQRSAQGAAQMRARLSRQAAPRGAAVAEQRPPDRGDAGRIGDPQPGDETRQRAQAVLVGDRAGFFHAAPRCASGARENAALEGHHDALRHPLDLPRAGRQVGVACAMVLADVAVQRGPPPPALRVARRIVGFDRLSADLDAEPFSHAASDRARRVTRREPADDPFALRVAELVRPFPRGLPARGHLGHVVHVSPPD